MFIAILSHKLRNCTRWGDLSPITYVLYQDISLVHQCHRLYYSGWKSHQHVMGNISTIFCNVLHVTSTWIEWRHYGPKVDILDYLGILIF